MMEPVLTDTESSAEAADVLIYTGSSWWITPADAAVEAETTKSRLQSAGIQTQITEDEAYVKEWMLQTTADGAVNVCILYGVIPDAIYSAGNTQPDGSVAENWIETPDGNTILNHADYIGWSSTDDPAKELYGDLASNRYGTLRNLMDNPNIWIDVRQRRIPMIVTADDGALTPSLVNFESDRPLPLNQLQGEWFAEKIFASDTGNAQATLADPVILRDGNLGRLAIVHQTSSEDNPKGEVAAEIIINYLLNPNAKFPDPLYVTFRDANLAKKVREALNLPAGAAIPKAQLATLTRLNTGTPSNAASEEKIRDLTGLEHATRLRELSLFRNEISDLTPLTALTQLTELNLLSNQISDLTPLTALTQLTELRLGYNQISDLTPLTALTQLRVLDLRSNQISDLIPLTALTQLTELRLGYNQISDLIPLTALTQLRVLDLGYNQISDSDLTPLTALTQLTELALYGNQLSDITPLAGLTQLTVLKISINQISDVTPLAGLTQLTWLNLSRNQISDITPLTGLTQLNGLHLWRNQISDITPLTELTQLPWLNLDNNQISDITPLTELTQLRVLYLTVNQISDVTALAGLTNLRELYLEGNQIADKAPLRTLLEKNPNVDIDIDVND